MIGVILFLALGCTIFSIYKSREKLWRKILGSIVLFAGVCCLGAGLTGGHASLLVHIIRTAILFIGGVWLLFPSKKPIIIATVVTLLDCVAYIPAHNRIAAKDEYHKTQEDRFGSVKQAEKNIDGTVWTYVEPSDEFMHKWVRMSFKNGKVYYQEASPSDGQWPNPEIMDYQVQEKRYSNNGEKYIGVTWKTNSDTDTFTFIPQTGQFKKFSAFGKNIEIFIFEGDDGWPD